MYKYATINKAWPNKFLITHSDLDVMQARPTPSYGSQFTIGEFSIHNRSGSAAVVGIGGRIQANIWSFSTWTDANYAAGTALTDDTTDAQDSGTGDVNLDTVATNNDGFVIGCQIPFNLASLVISQASAANTVWKVYYSIASAGTGFSSNYTEIATANMLVAPSFGSTGEQLLWFDPPPDWHKVESDTAIVNRHGRSSIQVAGLTHTPEYRLIVKSTTAPDTTRGQMSIAVLGHMVMSTAAVANGSILNNIGGNEFPLPPQCDAIMPAISVANSQNRAFILYRYGS